jgi:type I restriction enzyme S subunit
VSADKLVRVGDVLVNSTGTGTLGRVAQVRDEPHEPTTVDSHVTIVRPKDGLFFPEFFGYALIAIENQIQEGGEGCGGQTELARSKLANDYHVSFPTSIPEQRRIVAILDEAFEGIATAKANAEKNLQNAREVFESHLNAVFSQRGEGWVEKRLDEVGKTQTGSTPKASEPENLGKHIPFVKPGDFKPDGSITYDNEGLSQNGAAKARLVMAPSAIMVCIGATIGKSAYANRIIATNQQINSLTPATGISAKMVYYQMITVDFQRRVHENAGQATLPIINKSKWSSLSIFIPPTVDEQNHIVARLDNLHEETQRLESLYQKKLIALDELKQSLLHQAFNGDL